MHWLIVETGSNQRYIFTTNKQRLQVAASALVWQVGYEWISEAAQDKDCGLDYATDIDKFLTNDAAVLHVVKASGRAVLLVHNAADGHALTTSITKRALRENTGLDVWGYTGSAFESLSDAHDALFETDVLLREQRSKRLPPSMRHPLLPFHEPCAYTNTPAMTVGPESRAADDGEHSRSAEIDTLFERSSGARERLLDHLETDLDATDKATVRHIVVRLPDLKTGLAHNGWVGVLHADGNGIGKIFGNLRRTYAGRDFVEKQQLLSANLEALTWKALQATVLGRNAATGETAEWANTSPGKPFANTVLPIIVGGDDISLAVSGEIAFDLAALLVANFDHYARDPQLGGPFRQALGDVQNILLDLGEPVDDIPDNLSLAVGLVFTKPNHPFVHAISLAEDLTSEAKTHTARRCGAIASHVLFESAVRELGAIRESSGFPEGDRRFSYAGLPIAVPSGSSDSAVDHSPLITIDGARDLISALAPGGRDSGSALSRGQIQSLREALTEATSLANLSDRLNEARRRLDASIPPIIDKYLPPLPDSSQPEDEQPKIINTMFIAALDLATVRGGTAGEPEDGQ